MRAGNIYIHIIAVSLEKKSERVLVITNKNSLTRD